MDVAEQARAGRAGHDARRLAVLGRQRVRRRCGRRTACTCSSPSAARRARARRRGRPRRSTCSRCTCRSRPARCRPPRACSYAPVGHTGTHGGSSQCRQDFGKCTVWVFGNVAHLEGLHAVEEGAGRIAPYGFSSASGPALPDVFHSLQLVTQAWQPTQTLRSITSASCGHCCLPPRSEPGLARVSECPAARRSVANVRLSDCRAASVAALECARARRTSRPGR